MDRTEFFDYAEKHNLVVWSKECSDSAMKAFDRLAKIDEMIKEIESYNSPLIGKNVVLDIINVHIHRK